MCIDLHQTGPVGKGSDHLQLIKFWPSCSPGKEVCGGAKIFLAPPCYSQRAVFASLLVLFFIWQCFYHVLQFICCSLITENIAMPLVFGSISDLHCTETCLACVDFWTLVHSAQHWTTFVYHNHIFLSLLLTYVMSLILSKIPFLTTSYNVVNIFL